MADETPEQIAAREAKEAKDKAEREAKEAKERAEKAEREAKEAREKLEQETASRKRKKEKDDDDIWDEVKKHGKKLELLEGGKGKGKFSLWDWAPVFVMLIAVVLAFGVDAAKYLRKRNEVSNVK